MKKYILIIVALLLTACTSDRPKVNIKKITETKIDIDKNESKEMKSLKNALSLYTKATMDKDIKTLISFVYPKAFTVVPKEKMIEMLTKTFNSNNAPSIKDVEHIKIEPIQKYDKGLYSTLTSLITTVIKSPRPNDKKFEKYMLATLQKQLALRGTVTLDSEKHLFNIKHTNTTIALNEDGSWKFIGFKQAKQYIEKGIFPKMLIDKIK